MKKTLQLIFTVTILSTLINCESKTYRAPASIHAPGPKVRCGVKCISGPINKSYFHVESVRMKYLNTQDLPEGSLLTQSTLDQLDSYCKSFAKKQSRKSNIKMSYAAISTKANIHHGQIIKVNSKGKLQLPRAGKQRIRLNNICI